jgi:hypothetical protein
VIQEIEEKRVDLISPNPHLLKLPSSHPPMLNVSGLSIRLHQSHTKLSISW